MGELVDTLGQKNPGELILASNWNDLVAAVEAIQVELAQQIADLGNELRAGLTQVQADVATLQATVSGLEATVAVVRQQHRVNLSTERVNYALGEIATLTAQVTDFEGNPLNLADEASRPWVDFVTAWGQLKPASGFVGITGEQGRSVAVRVNAQGIAQATLRTEIIVDFSDEDEFSVADALTAVVPNTNISFAQLVLQANTPVQAQASGAFALMSQEYDVTGDTAFKRFADGYYKTSPNIFVKPVTGRWREYHATVLVMSRNDNDPTTPDQGRGASSIQVTFRDWIGPWFELDYLDTGNVFVGEYINRFKTRVNPNKYGESLVGIYDEVQEIAGGKGIIGQLREYRAANQALNQLDLDNPPAFLNDLIKDSQSFVNVQQTLLYAQANTPGLAGGATLLSGVAGAAAQSEGNLGDIQADVDTLTGQIDGIRATAEGIVAQAETRVGKLVADAQAAFNQQFTGLDTRMGGLAGQLDSLANNFTTLNQRYASEVPAIGKQFDELKLQIGEVEQNITSNIGSQLIDLQKNVGQLQGRIGTVEGRFDLVDSAVLGENGQFQRLQRSLETLQGQVNSFQIEGVQPSRIASGLLKVDNFEDRFSVLSERLARLEGGG